MSSPSKEKVLTIEIDFMELQNAAKRVFEMLTASLDQLEEAQYTHTCENLSGNTVGQHVRHIIEMYQRLELGYQMGEINYDNRKRDKKIETDKNYATWLLNEIVQQIQKENKNLEKIQNTKKNKKRKFQLVAGSSWTYSSFNQVLCANINHCAANSLRRIEAEGVIFIPLPWIKDLLSVDSSFIYGPRNSYINKLTTWNN